MPPNESRTAGRRSSPSRRRASAFSTARPARHERDVLDPRGRPRGRPRTAAAAAGPRARRPRPPRPPPRPGPAAGAPGGGRSSPRRSCRGRRDGMPASAAAAKASGGMSPSTSRAPGRAQPRTSAATSVRPRRAMNARQAATVAGLVDDERVLAGRGPTSHSPPRPPLSGGVTTPSNRNAGAEVADRDRQPRRPLAHGAQHLRRPRRVPEPVPRDVDGEH